MVDIVSDLQWKERRVTAEVVHLWSMKKEEGGSDTDGRGSSEQVVKVGRR